MSFPGRLVMTASAVVLAVSMSFASGFQLNEHGARAMAQGGAFAARAYDGSAIFFNPGGLGFQSKPSAYLGTTLIFPSSSFYGPLQLNTSAETKIEPQMFTPINVYGVYPIMDGLTVGLGINNPYGLGTEWPVKWVGRHITQKVDLVSFFITPTVSYRVLDNLSIGVGFNYVLGTVTISRYVPVSSVNTNPESEVSLDMSGTGMGFNVGVLYKATPEISIGASYRHSVKIDADGTAKFNPNYSALGFPEGDAAASLTLPYTAFVGVAVHPMKELEIEADVQFTGWSSYDSLKVEFKKNNSSTSSPKMYENSFIVRVGGEYSLGDLKLRAGYLYDQSPVQEEYAEPMLPDANRHGINIGFGYQLTENLSVDVAYLFLKFVDREVTNSIPENSFDGTYKSVANLFGVNFGYTF